MTTLAAMRTANVADFHITKYLSKAQEALGPVMQPFITGMRRIATAESAPEAVETTRPTRTAKNTPIHFLCKSHDVVSACEFAVFLTTGDSCIRT